MWTAPVSFTSMIRSLVEMSSREQRLKVRASVKPLWATYVNARKTHIANGHSLWLYVTGFLACSRSWSLSLLMGSCFPMVMDLGRVRSMLL